MTRVHRTFYWMAMQLNRLPYVSAVGRNRAVWEVLRRPNPRVGDISFRRGSAAISEYNQGYRDALLDVKAWPEVLP